AARLLDVYGIRAFLVGTPAQVPKGSRVLYSGPDGTVVANPTALPDAWVAYGWRPATSADTARELVASGSRRALLDEPAIETGATPPGRAGAATPARAIMRTDTKVTIEAVAERAGHLVLLDSFFPGWIA